MHKRNAIATAHHKPELRKETFPNADSRSRSDMASRRLQHASHGRQVFWLVTSGKRLPGPGEIIAGQ
jgi:hypothetical protein